MKKTFILCAFAAAIFAAPLANATATETQSAIESVATASNDWDKVLDSYEKYVDKYVATYKKAMAGDMTALAEYAKLAAEAEKLQKKLEKAEGEMTTAQAARYAKITQKMLNALK